MIRHASNNSFCFQENKSIVSQPITEHFNILKNCKEVVESKQSEQSVQSEQSKQSVQTVLLKKIYNVLVKIEENLENLS